MTDEAAELLEGAAAAREVADALHHIRDDQRRARWMGWVIAGETGLLVVLIVVLIVLALPVIRTARTVEAVAGPDAQKRAAAGQAGVVALILCQTRENTSEARVMDGKQPLPLRQGCPPYDFSPSQPILPTTTTTIQRRRTTATTARHRRQQASTTTTARSQPPTTATATRPSPCPRPTAPVTGTCPTAP
jgi:cell division septation protein DedD